MLAGTVTCPKKLRFADNDMPGARSHDGPSWTDTGRVPNPPSRSNGAGRQVSGCGHDACMPPHMPSIIKQNDSAARASRPAQPRDDPAHPGGGERRRAALRAARASPRLRPSWPSGRSPRPWSCPTCFSCSSSCGRSSPWLSRQPFAHGRRRGGAGRPSCAGVLLYAPARALHRAVVRRAAALGAVRARSPSRRCCSISTCAHARCRRRSPRPGCRRCRRASVRTSCSTASTPCCRSCAASPSGPRSRCRTWRTCSAC